MSNKMINNSNTKTGTHKTKYSSRLQRELAKAILASVQPRRDPHKSTGIAHADPLNKKKPWNLHPRYQSLYNKSHSGTGGHHSNLNQPPMETAL